MRWFIYFALGLLAAPAAMANVVAARDIPVGTIISGDDLSWDDQVSVGLSENALAVGKQARIAIYKGRPVTAAALRAPVLVERNQIVRIVYAAGSLRIATEGRALTEGAAGQIVRAMNLTSRKTISARVADDGTLLAGDQLKELR
ncbi:flagellar basal body P-ring formation chaperone FlgA [Paracoccus albus]|uniref:flagellar basal body P-ring formation chaperone FlgA n=1 Tax=Paracoccus albus TaxID=3017784 RepID=UPI0022F1225F|nr:flagellar basal body P-ring formation chaperone FlgA [Paracoccus albus]WBU59792.1 flagellar basal body P-ring formation chaperone FlgA [Paracoccus albus]